MRWKLASCDIPAAQFRAHLHRGVSFCAALGIWHAGAETAWADGPALDRRVGWRDWNHDPVVWLSLIFLAWLYMRGLRASQMRIAPRCSAKMQRHPVAFALGLVCLAAAILSPLDLLSDQLASAHMVQHMLLVTVAAPLVVMGAPQLVCLWGLPLHQRRIVGRARRACERWHVPSTLLWNPLLVWTLYALTVWAWHAPVLYQAALRNQIVHDLQHLTFFAAACLYWRVLLVGHGRLRLNRGLGVLYLFTTTLHTTVLGVFMTLAPTVWYRQYEGRTGLWGLTALEDQQLAGLIMWMPACVPYVVAAIALLVPAIRESASETRWPILQSTE